MDERISNLLEELSKKMDIIIEFIISSRYKDNDTGTKETNEDGSSPNLSMTNSSSSIVSFDCSD